MAKMTQAQMAEREDAKTFLLSILSPGSVVYTSLNSVSRSGMSREISLYATKDGEIVNITWHAAAALGDKTGKTGGIKIGGCGMDMGFALVYNLGATLWPNGTQEPHGTRNGEPDTCGGYALKHHWM